jgi:16S rRNA C1402 (ribose-2'-O) methylase RsmI
MVCCCVTLIGNSSLPLSVVVNSLRELSVSYFTELEVSQNLQKKSDNLSDMTFEDMKQVIYSSPTRNTHCVFTCL